MIQQPATTLIIIGNGFDLQHGIKSRYADFASDLRSIDNSLFEAMQEYLPGVEEDWWNLEKALGGPDVDQMEDYAGQFLMSYGDDNWSDAGHHDYQYELEQIADALSTQLLKRFTEWVHRLMLPDKPLSHLIKIMQPAHLYLSFNYTQTLESIYRIPPERVLHIHGSTTDPTSQFVLGHDYDKLPSRNAYYPGIEDQDPRVAEGNEIIDDYFKRTFKPSAAILEKNRTFFESLGAIETIYVLGHSLADVDVPYLSAIIENISRPARWVVAARSSCEGDEKVDRLNEFEVSRDSIEVCQWQHLA